jgi:predicted GNAT family acetyltransferase
VDDDERLSAEDLLDETLEESFPASDPPANTVETGIGLSDAATSHYDVTDNREGSRFELAQDGKLAVLNYERQPGVMVLVHTEMPAALRNHHLGERLVKAALTAAHAEGRRIIAVCPFVRAYLRRHPASDDAR